MKPQLSRSAQDGASLFPGKCLPLSHNCDLNGEPTDSLPPLGPPVHLPGYPVSVPTVNLKEEERNHLMHPFQALSSPALVVLLVPQAAPGGPQFIPTH